MNGNGSRGWAVIMLLLSVAFGIAGWLLQRELNNLSARLDRITEFVLEHHTK